MIRDRGYKSRIVPEIPGQLEPMDSICVHGAWSDTRQTTIDKHKRGHVLYKRLDDFLELKHDQVQLVSTTTAWTIAHVVVWF